MTSVGESTGARIRAVRREHGLSLSALAAAAGVGKGTLSELEAGRRNPTLDTLYAIAGPLGVPLAALVADADADAEVADESLSSLRLHLRDDGRVTTEVYLIRVRPGAVRRSPPHAPGATEQLVVLAGEGTLEVDGVPERMAAGTHHAWAADRPHSYACTSTDELVAVDVIVTPG